MKRKHILGEIRYTLIPNTDAEIMAVRDLLHRQPDEEFLTLVLGLDEEWTPPEPVVPRGWCPKHEMWRTVYGNGSSTRCEQCYEEWKISRRKTAPETVDGTVHDVTLDPVVRLRLAAETATEKTTKKGNK